MLKEIHEEPTVVNNLISIILNQKTIDLNFDTQGDITEENTKGALGDFSLLSPSDNGVVSEPPLFTWEISENAITYTLEVSSHESFDSSSSNVVYYKETNIAATSFRLSSPLKTKNINYFWRVTAVNNFNTNSVGKEKMSSNTFKFYYESQNVGEIAIDVGEEADWSLHKAGSYATVSIDHSDFFNSGKSDSLSVTFEQEDTKRGNVTSDGWLAVSKPLEMDLYGTDALYFNFYYSGNDADVVVRFIDADGEYWHSYIKVSQNAKQTVLIKFSDFVLRTKDTTVQNEIFNFEHVQYFELVFEHAFGDGAAMLGNIKAVNFESYSNLFIEKLNFNSFDESTWVTEAYNFKKTISDDGSELKLEYQSSAGFNGNEKGVGSYGYGFAKLSLNCYFATGNAIKVKIKYEGSKTTDNSIIRVYEEDTDRWSYEQKFSGLSNEYTQFTIPFAAFAKSQILGDGNRQFSYILNLQFGASNLDRNGAIYYKDFEIVTLPSVSENKKIVGNDGIIDDFENYDNRTQLYEYWESSVENKDEGMFLNSTDKYVDGINEYAGQFTYKSDMSIASYDTYLDVNYQGGNALKFWIKDMSTYKSNESGLSYLTPSDIAASVVIQLVLTGNRWYRYTIESAPRRWTEYTINFSDFELYSGVELETSDPFLSQNVVNFAFGLQYIYYLQNGTPHPIYSESNPVLFDNIRFANSDETVITPLEKELHPDTDNAKFTRVDEFEYNSNEELNMHWLGLNGLDFEHIELSNDVSSSGGNHSMKLDYKGSSSPSYATYPAFGDDVTAKAMQVDIKGDGVATVYINLYIRVGTTTYQYRHTIYNVADSWNRYVIGFDSSLFIPQGSNPAQVPAININSMPSVQRITFGIVNTSGTTVSSIYVDNLCVDASVKSFTTHSITAL